MTNPTAPAGRHARPSHRRATDRNRSEFHTALEDWARWTADARRAERLATARRIAP